MGSKSYVRVCMCVYVCVCVGGGGGGGDQWVLGVMSKTSSTLYLIVLKRFCSNGNTS